MKTSQHNPTKTGRRAAGEEPTGYDVRGVMADLKQLRANPRLKGWSWRKKMIPKPKHIAGSFEHEEIYNEINQHNL